MPEGKCVTVVALVFDGSINRLWMAEEAIVLLFLPYKVTEHQV